MNTKLEQCVLDLFDDCTLDQTLRKIACNLSNDIKREELPTASERDSLEDYQFALTLITKTASKLNKFPINDKVNTAFSNEYFELNNHKLPIEAQKIAAVYIGKACDKFGIDAHNSVKVAGMNYEPRTNIFVESLLRPQDSRLIKMASPAAKISENYYALGTKYAMPDETYLRKAEQYFEKHAKKLSPNERHEFATNVSKRSSELGIKIASVAISKYAGSNYNPDLESHLKLRQKLLDDASPYIPALRKLASFQSTTGPETFAKVLHEIDKKAGLNKYYDSSLCDPYASTFGSMSKTAGYAYESDGIYLTGDDIEKVARDKYDVLKNYFGHTLADGLKKEGTAAFEALPTDAKDIIARISNGEIQ